MPRPTRGWRCKSVSCLSLRQTLHILPYALHKWDAAERSNRHIHTPSPATLSKWTVWHKEKISEMERQWQKVLGEETVRDRNVRQQSSEWVRWTECSRELREHRQRQRKVEDRGIKRNKVCAREWEGTRQSVPLVTLCMWITNCTGREHDWWWRAAGRTQGGENKKILKKTRWRERKRQGQKTKLKGACTAIKPLTTIRKLWRGSTDWKWQQWSF